MTTPAATLGQSLPKSVIPARTADASKHSLLAQTHLLQFCSSLPCTPVPAQFDAAILAHVLCLCDWCCCGHVDVLSPSACLQAGMLLAIAVLCKNDGNARWKFMERACVGQVAKALLDPNLEARLLSALNASSTNVLCLVLVPYHPHTVPFHIT